MIEKIIDVELKYKACFSEFKDCSTYIRYSDLKLLDMRAHNNIVIKRGTSEELKREIILAEMNLRKEEGYDFLKVISFDSIHQDTIDKFIIKPEVDIYDYMIIESRLSCELKTKENTTVMVANNSNALSDGRAVDIEANKTNMGEEFAIRRIDRKIKVYNDKNIPLNLYVCYDHEGPVGNCELFLDDHIAKIEDFDILQNYQKMGYGTHFLKELLSETSKCGIDYAYVVTDHFDSAKDMYRKCGFRYIGSVTELLFTL